MFEFLGEVESLAGDLYPYRWAIAAAVGLLAAGSSALAVRLRWHDVVWRHRLLAAAIAVPVVAVMLPVGWYTLSPLWERSRLDEASPLAAGAPAMREPSAGTVVSAPPEEPPFVASITRSGTFAGADDFHFGRGAALLIETSPGTYTLRFENFSVRNGPDLVVYLTDDPQDVSGAVNLGGLKATDGNFNYDVPAEVDVASYRYAIVWCRQFATLFAAAPLEIA